MQQISFLPNNHISLFNQIHQIVSISEQKQLVLRNDQGKEKAWEFETLIAHYLQGNCRVTQRRLDKPADVRPRKIVTRRLSDASEIAKQEAYARQEYLRTIEREGISLSSDSPRLRAILDEVSNRLGRAQSPSRSSLKNWRRKQRRMGNDPVALVPDYNRRGAPGKSRFPLQIVADMEYVIDTLYLVAGGLSAATAYQHLQARIAERNQWLPATGQDPTPSYPTFLRAIQQRGGYEVLAAREGAREAERRYRSSGKNTENYGFNECWEIDHTVLDLFAVDPRTGLPLGRPRFTACIEWFSRCVMGIDLDFTGNTSQAVLNCLKHGILPKTYLKEKYPSVQGEWPCFGIPQVLKCDNGAEFHSQSLRDACMELGIELLYCPVKKPWFKARIERFFRTFNGHALAGLPGATGSHLYNRGDRSNPADDAVISLEQLQEYLHIWVVDIYLPGFGKGVQ